MAVYLPLGLHMRIWPPGLRPSVSSFMLNIASCGSSVLVISRQTASIDPRMKTLKTAFSVSGMTFPLRRGLQGGGLHLVLEAGEFTGPESAVLGGPAVVDDLNRNDIEIESALAAHFFRMEELGPLQHADVLEHRDAARGEMSTQVLDAATGMIAHEVKHAAAVPMGQRLEH